MSSWGSNDTRSNAPKWLNVSGTYSKWNTAGVSTNEMANNAVNTSVNFVPQHAGWVLIQPTYTDSNGIVRKKSETLVAMSTIAGGNGNNRITGTANITNGNAYVIGTGTKFTTELQVGTIVSIGGTNVFSITVIANSTFANINASPTTFNSNTQNIFLMGDYFEPLTGLMNITNATVNVVGNGTLFTTELTVGEVIAIGANTSNVRAVASITNATFMTVNTAMTATVTGLTANVTDFFKFRNY